MYHQFHKAVYIVLGSFPGGGSMAGYLEQKTADALLRLASVLPSSAASMVLVNYTKYPL